MEATGWAASQSAKTVTSEEANAFKSIECNTDIGEPFLELGSAGHNVMRQVKGLTAFESYRLRFQVNGACTSADNVAARVVVRVDNLPVFGALTYIKVGRWQEYTTFFMPGIDTALLRFENGSPDACMVFIADVRVDKQDAKGGLSRVVNPPADARSPDASKTSLLHSTSKWRATSSDRLVMDLRSAVRLVGVVVQLAHGTDFLQVMTVATSADGQTWTDRAVVPDQRPDFFNSECTGGAETWGACGETEDDETRQSIQLSAMTHITLKPGSAGSTAQYHFQCTTTTRPKFYLYYKQAAKPQLFVSVDGAQTDTSWDITSSRSTCPACLGSGKFENPLDLDDASAGNEAGQTFTLPETLAASMMHSLTVHVKENAMVLTRLVIKEQDCRWLLRYHDDVKYSYRFVEGEVVAQHIRLTTPASEVPVAGVRAGLLVRSTVETNVYVPAKENTSVVVPWGGRCECPDGKQYEVSAAKNKFGRVCENLACRGGTTVPGSCSVQGIGSVGVGMEVTCFGADLQERNATDGATPRGGEPATGSQMPGSPGNERAASGECPNLPDWVVADDLFSKDLVLDISGTFNETAMDPGADAFDIGDDKFLDVVSDWSEVAAEFKKKTYNPGIFVTYMAKDSVGNAIMAHRKVILKDNTPPIITMKGDLGAVLEAKFGTIMPDAGATAEDIVEGDVTDRITVKVLRDPNARAVSIDSAVEVDKVDLGLLGKFSMVYTAHDTAGNMQTATNSIIVQDTIPPTLDLDFPSEPKLFKVGKGALDGWLKQYGVSTRAPAAQFGLGSNSTAPAMQQVFDSQSMSWNYGVPWAEPGYQISDNHLQEYALRNRTVIDQAIDTSAPLGTVYFVEYTIVDDGDNTQTASRTVVIIDSQPPQLTVRGLPEASMYTGGVLLERNENGEEVEFSDQGADISDLFDSGPYGGGAVYNSKDIIDVEKGESLIDKCKFKLCRRGYAAVVGEDPERSPFPAAGNFKVEYISVDKHDNIGVAVRTFSVVQLSEPSSSAGAIGGAIGGAVFLACCIAVAFIFVRRKARSDSAQLAAASRQDTYTTVNAAFEDTAAGGTPKYWLRSARRCAARVL